MCVLRYASQQRLDKSPYCSACVPPLHLLFRKSWYRYVVIHSLVVSKQCVYFFLVEGVILYQRMDEIYSIYCISVKVLYPREPCLLSSLFSSVIYPVKNEGLWIENERNLKNQVKKHISYMSTHNTNIIYVHQVKCSHALVYLCGRLREISSTQSICD